MVAIAVAAPIATARRAPQLNLRCIEAPSCPVRGVGKNGCRRRFQVGFNLLARGLLAPPLWSVAKRSRSG